MLGRLLAGSVVDVPLLEQQHRARVDIRRHSAARRRAAQVTVGAVHVICGDGSRRERCVLLRLDGLQGRGGHLQHLACLLAAALNVRRDPVANLESKRIIFSKNICVMVWVTF